MSKRKRDPTFAASEKLALIELVERHFDVVECKKTDSVNIKMKNEEWQRIALEFNAISSIHPRDWGVLKNCWENLKKRAKQTQTLRNQHFMGTGGGPPKKINEDPAIERVLELIQTRVTGLSNCYDSDGTLVLSSGSILGTQQEEGTSDQPLHDECANNIEVHVSDDDINNDWSQHVPSMLRKPKNPALARPQSPEGVFLALPVASPDTDIQLPVANSQLFEPQLPEAYSPNAPISINVATTTCTITQAATSAASTSRRRPVTVASNHGPNAPMSTHVATTCTTTPQAATSAASTSRRRPFSTREREAQSLARERINTLLKCNTHAEEEHELNMKILKLKELKEKEILEQEKLKTQQEKIKLQILEIQLKKLNE